VNPVVVLDVVGLTPRLLPHMPRLSALADDGFRARLDTVLPAVTCTVQSSLLTGLPPSEHGVVGNGWYFRELGEPLLWRQHNALVQGEKVWDAARLPRRRAEVARLLHGPRLAARRADRHARTVPAVHLLGPDGRDRLVAVDRPGGRPRPAHGEP
jgi:hypothetical protein